MQCSHFCEQGQVVLDLNGGSSNSLARLHAFCRPCYASIARLKWCSNFPETLYFTLFLVLVYRQWLRPSLTLLGIGQQVVGERGFVDDEVLAACGRSCTDCSCIRVCSSERKGRKVFPAARARCACQPRLAPSPLRCTASLTCLISWRV